MALIMDTKIEKRKRKRRHDFIIDWIMCSKYEKNIIGLVVDIIGGGEGEPIRSFNEHETHILNK